MKKLFSLFAVALALSTGSTSRAESLFTENEVSLIGFANYTDKTDDYWGGGIGLTYFLTRNVGIGASTTWTDFKGAFFDNVSGEGYLRLPLGDAPLAIYGIGSGGYTWEFNNWFFGAGAGAELRFSKQFGVFSDIQWLFNEGGDNDGVGVRIGIRLGM